MTIKINLCKYKRIIQEKPTSDFVCVTITNSYTESIDTYKLTECILLSTVWVPTLDSVTTTSTITQNGIQYNFVFDNDAYREYLKQYKESEEQRFKEFEKDLHALYSDNICDSIRDMMFHSVKTQVYNNDLRKIKKGYIKLSSEFLKHD